MRRPRRTTHVVLWGGRRGDRQLGSPRDHLVERVLVELHNARLMVLPPAATRRVDTDPRERS